MKRSQTTHMLWMLLITILLGAPNIHASTMPNMVEASEIDTASSTASKSRSVDTLSIVPVLSAEEKVIQKIEIDLAKPKFVTDINEKAEYIYHELAAAARCKHLHVIDYLLSINFQHDPYLLLNASLAHIVGIPAARGDEDLAIIERILNAKQAAFVRFGERDGPQHMAEMTEIANRIIAFSSSNDKFVRIILDNTSLICFDVNGVNWALRNITREQPFAKKYEIIDLLYNNKHVKPDLEGTIDAIEIAFDSNNDKDLITILMLDIKHNHRTISDILKESMLNVRAHIVRNIVNAKRMEGRYFDISVLNENSKILSMIKFYIDSTNAISREEKNEATAIARKIQAEVSNGTMPFINVACCELVKAVYKLHIKTNETASISEHVRYVVNRNRFKENMLPLLLLNLHGERGLKLHPDVYRQLTELWNELLIQSFTCSDYEMGIDLLNEKYNIGFDQQTIQILIYSIEDKQATKKRKVKIENATQEAISLSSEDQFLRLLKSRRI